MKKVVKTKGKSSKGPTKHALAMARQVQHNKKMLLEALERSLGVVSVACKAVQLDRTTFYNYMKSDPEFVAAVKELDNVALDFAESQLHKQIEAGVPASTIFYLKTKGRGRGYIEVSQHDHQGEIKITRVVEPDALEAEFIG